MIKVKRVLKLLVKCFFVMLPFVILCTYMSRHALAFVDGEAPYYIWNREKTNTSQEKRYRVVILGDSVANAAYVPEVLSDDTINLALGGTTPEENYYTLCDWLDHNTAPEVCYISFQDFHMQRSDCFWTRSMYSHRYRPQQSLEMLRAAVSYEEPSILTEHYRLDFLSYQMYLPDKYITSFMNAGFNQRYQMNAASVQADELHGGRYIARGTNEYSGTDPILFEEFHVNPLYDEYYQKIIRLCMERGIKLRIVKLPLPENEQFTDEYRKTFYGYYHDLQRKYPDVTVDWFPAYPIGLFADGAHMNSHGALQFSRELKERYPDDFTVSGTEAERALAVNDSVSAENKVEWILKWISGMDYTVIFCDQTGNFQSLYKKKLQKEWGTEDLRLNPVTMDGAGPDQNDGNNPAVWKISGIGESDHSVTLLPAENGFMIQTGNESHQWIPAAGDILGVAVIDQYHSSVVCMKSFRYMDGEYALVQ